MTSRLFRTALAGVCALLAGAAAARAQTADCEARVVVEARPGAGPALDVTWRCRSAQDVVFGFDNPASTAHASQTRDAGAETAAAPGGVWRAVSREGVATFRYRFDLAAWAGEIDRVSLGVRRGGGVLSILSGWLVAPRLVGVAIPTLDIRIDAPAG